MNKCMSVCRTVALLLILVLTFGFTVFAESEEGGTEAPPAEPVTQQQEEQPNSPNPEAQQNNKKSSNSDLASLSVVGKRQDGSSVEIQLSPEFKRSTRTYSISVPYDVVSLEINAVAADSKSRIDIPQGYLTLDVGANKSFVYVIAENGARRTYQINSVRASEETTVPVETVTAEPQTQAQPTTEPQAANNITQTEAASTVPVEIENTHSVYYKLAIAFGAIGLILLVVAIALFYRNKRLREGRF